MHPVRAVTRPPLWPGPVSAWATQLHQGLFRSALAGQANAILVDPSDEVEDLGHERISDPWRERRLVQAVRIDGHAVVANLHATNDLRRPGGATCGARPGACLRGGRRLLRGTRRDGRRLQRALPDVARLQPRHRWHGSRPRCGAEVSAPFVWPIERRVDNGVMLSDYAPVELTLGGSKAITKNV